MKDLLKKYLEILRRHIVLVVYIVLWAVMAGCFWLMETNADAFAYSVIWFYLALPICSFVVAIVYGAGNHSIKYFLPILFGILETLGGFFTFQLANVIANGKWNSWNIPDLQMSLYSLIPALVGLLIGMAVRMIRTKNASRRGK